MDATQTRTRTDSVVGFLFDYAPRNRRLTLARLETELEQLEDLINLARASLAPNLRRGMGSGVAARSGRPMSRGGRGYRIEHLSFNSPLEIIIAIPGVVGAGTYVGSQLLKLWGDWDSARVAHAEAGAQIELKQAHQEAIRYMRSNLAEAVTRAGDKKAFV